MRAMLIVSLLTIMVTSCGPKETSLDVYAGDAAKKAMLAIQESYAQLHPNITINYNFAASDTLAATIRTLQQGDLYVGPPKIIESFNQDGLLVDSYPLASLVPAIIVRAGDNIVASWDDLAKEGVRITMLNPELGAAGRAADKVISNSSLNDQIRANITGFAADATAPVQMLVDGEVDAVIIWSGVAQANPNLTIVEIPEEINSTLEIWVAVLTYTTAENDALAFAEFMTGSDGLQAFGNAGFFPIEK